MQSKYCSKCQKTLPVGEFRPNRSRFDRLQTYCITCDKTHQQEHYRKNKEAYLFKAKETKNRAVQFVRSFKEGKPCADCGNVYHPFVMDFDHLYDKVRDISQMARRGASEESLLNEMAKCELVCANCHRMRTLTRTLGAKAVCKTV